MLTRLNDSFEIDSSSLVLVPALVLYDIGRNVKADSK